MVIFLKIYYLPDMRLISSFVCALSKKWKPECEDSSSHDSFG